ncbi:MAG TPA: hypothetical protein VIE44_13270 [Methylomirabilota bacterium]|jgi:hypothetical protein
MTADADPRSTSLDPLPGNRARIRTPWLLVVARGHARLVTELQAMFRDDPRVLVIENRRQGHALLPRAETVTRGGLTAG